MTRGEYIQLYELLGKFEKDRNGLLKLLAEKYLSELLAEKHSSDIINAVKLIKDVAVYGF